MATRPSVIIHSKANQTVECICHHFQFVFKLKKGIKRGAKRPPTSSLDFFYCKVHCLTWHESLVITDSQAAYIRLKLQLCKYVYAQKKYGICDKKNIFYSTLFCFYHSWIKLIQQSRSPAFCYSFIISCPKFGTCSLSRLRWLKVDISFSGPPSNQSNEHWFPLQYISADQLLISAVLSLDE